MDPSFAPASPVPNGNPVTFGRTERDGALRLGEATMMRVDAAEGNQPPVRRRGGVKHAVVDGAVGPRLRQRKHDRAWLARIVHQAADNRLIGFW